MDCQLFLMDFLSGSHRSAEANNCEMWSQDCEPSSYNSLFPPEELIAGITKLAHLLSAVTGGWKPPNSLSNRLDWLSCRRGSSERCWVFYQMLQAYITGDATDGGRTQSPLYWWKQLKAGPINDEGSLPSHQISLFVCILLSFALFGLRVLTCTEREECLMFGLPEGTGVVFNVTLLDLCSVTRCNPVSISVFLPFVSVCLGLMHTYSTVS